MERINRANLNPTFNSIEPGPSNLPASPVQVSHRSLGIPARTQVSVGTPIDTLPLQISADLLNRASNLVRRLDESNPPGLRFYTEQMNLEGLLLKEHNSLPYSQLASTLNPGLRAHDQNGGDRDACLAELCETLNNLPSGQSHSNVEGVNNALVKFAEEQADYLAVAASRYGEVLTQPNLSKEQKENIVLSHKAFMDYAQNVGKEIPQLLKKNVDKLKNDLATSEELIQLSREYVSALSDAPNDERTLAEGIAESLAASHETYKSALDCMTELKEAYKPPELLKDALHNAQLPSILDDFEEQLSPTKKLNAKAMAAAVQGGASALHFGATRAGVESAVAGASFIRSILASGTALGTAHEIVNNTTRPASQNLLEAAGGLGIRAVKPTEVMLRPLRITTVDGKRHERTDEEFAAAVKKLEDLTERFMLEQNKFKFGTPQGEGIAFLSFGAAQAALEALVSSGTLPAKTVWALALTSALGGAGMAWGQADGQLNTRIRDNQGRDLPTHLPQATSGTLADRLGKTASSAMKALDVREKGPREAFLSKIFGSIQGVALSTAAADSVRDLPIDTAANIVRRLVISALGPTETLSSFFANMQVAPEAKKAGTGRLELASRNMTDPDRDSLPHTTTRGTTARTAENTWHRVRGALQVPAQGAVEITATGFQLAAIAGTSLSTRVRAVASRNTEQDGIELAERGQAPAP